MFAFFLAACLAQSDLGSIPERHDFDDVEKLAAQNELHARIVALRLDELTRQAATLQVHRGEAAPVVFVEVVTLVEHRRLERRTEPYDGPPLPSPTVKDPDPWGPPLPAWEGYGERSWHLPVKGTEASQVCPGCRGARELACKTCRGMGKLECERCHGQGTVRCRSCDGNGRDRCSSCGGDGRKRSFGRTKRCTMCGGDGRRNCGRCRGGKATCSECRGNRDVECKACRGKKKTTCTTCQGRGGLRSYDAILIHLRPETTATTWTRLVGPWEVPRPEEGWIEVEGDRIETAAAQVADEGLRGHLLALVRKAHEGATRPRGQLLRVAVVPCRWVEYEANHETYEALLTPNRVIEFDSLAMAWARERVRDAEKILAGINLDLDGAAAQARMALRAHPESASARDVLNRVGAKQRELLAILATTKPTESEVAIEIYVAIGVGVVLVTLVMLALVRRGPKRTPLKGA